MSPLSNATTLANYASGIGTQGATLEIQTANKRVGIGTTNPQGPAGSLQVGTAVTISGNSGIVSAATFHGDFGSSTSVAGNLSVSGVLTYEDVTNIDSIGIMTARSHLSIADKIIHTGDTNTAIRFPAADTITAETGGNERLRIDSSGRLLVGASSAATGGTLAQYATFVLRGDSGGSSNAGIINLARGTGAASMSSGFSAGVITFSDNAGLEFGDIGINADGSPSGSSTPGRFVVKTTASGATTSTERMRIDSSGNIGVGNASPAYKLSVLTTGTTDTSLHLATSGGSSANGDATNAIRFTGGTNSRWANAKYEAFNHIFHGNGVENMRIDSSGNILVGTTTAGFASYGDALTIARASHCGMTLRGGTTSDTEIFFADGTTGTARYTGGIRYAHNTDHMQFTVNAAERMRIDSAGRVMIGTTSRGQDSADDLTIGNASADAGITIRSSNSTTGNIFFSQTTSSSGGASYQGYIQYYQGTSRLYFGTGSTAKALIGQYGYFHASADGQFHGDLASTSSYHSFDTDLAQWTCEFRSRNSSSPAGVLIHYSAASPNNSVNAFIYAQDQSAARFQVRSNGGIANFSANNANLCDEREKKNIVSLDAKWDKVKSWDLKKFHYNEDANTDDLRYGVIAQQVETVCPEVLTDWEKQASAEAELDEYGNVITPAKEQILRKGVKEQQMMWMAIKALQEAQARIETLETQNADLLVRITALEG